jgi:GntR family transcriptional regulator
LIVRTLRDEGLLEFRRGRGITVAASPDRGAVTAGARQLVALARKHGYEPRELIQIIEGISTSA